MMHSNESLAEVSVGSDGEFSLEVEEFDPNELKFFTTTGSTIPISQFYPIVFDRYRPPMVVISDMDDTILISKSSKFFSKLWLMLFRQTSKRNFVEESERAYRILKKLNIPFFYVSASEANLFGTITNFLVYHELPLGPIFLRPFNRWKNLLRRTERKNYKEERIRHIVECIPGSRVVLFGDDSQDDPAVFKSVLRAFPSAIHGIFIRRTDSKTMDLANDFKKEKSALREAFHYSEFSEIREAINRLTHEYPHSS